MDRPLVSIITPTWHGDPAKLRRCLNSVTRQSYQHFEHFVTSDGAEERAARQVVASFNDRRICYQWTATRFGGWGAAVRQQVMLYNATGKYLVFLDDDNIIFPAYLERMLAAFRAEPLARMAICEELHFGPLQPFHGEPPVVLAGVPRLYHIDTLQAMVEAEAMRTVGWVGNSYCADGETYSALAQRYPYVNVPEVLCVHM